MRIVMTTDAVGGVWAYTLELCRSLHSHGCEVVLACMGGSPGAEERSDAENLPNVTLRESNYRLEWMEDPWRDLPRAADWLDALSRESGADLLHLNCYGPALRAYDVPVLLTAHSCVHSWWRATRGTDPGPRWKRYRDAVMTALDAADAIVAPTAASLAAMRSCYPEVNIGPRASVIHNGIDASRWAGVREHAAPFVLGVGRIWDEGKNLRRLAAIAPQLSCPVLIAGAGELAPEPDGAVMLGALPRNRLGSYYRRAAIFAHPARYEPFGLAVAEAALAGCPLLLGDIPTLRELWDGVAVFADPDDESLWRDTLEKLLADPAERRRMGRAARSRALGFSAAAMGSAYAALYERLLQLPERVVA